MSVSTVIIVALMVGVYLAYQWGSAALIKYKRDNDLH